MAKATLHSVTITSDDRRTIKFFERIILSILALSPKLEVVVETTAKKVFIEDANDERP